MRYTILAARENHELTEVCGCDSNPWALGDALTSRMEKYPHEMKNGRLVVRERPRYFLVKVRDNVTGDFLARP